MANEDPEEELQKVPGVGPATARRLAEAGYTTIEALASASAEELVGIVGAKGGDFIAAAREVMEMEKERVPEEVEMVAEEEKVPVVEEVEEIEKVPEEVRMVAEVGKEQGPFLDLIDKITEKETTLNIDIEDVGGRLFGRSLRLMGKVRFDLGTLKKPE
jgi:DNA polymerase/3'-5' exonuclease PolX